ncbi:MAG TPA: hypothetical protein VL947_00915, partial [Cytophagales bacterium]|nr:hypothetical protein [Cytophagales bacterium]
TLALLTFAAKVIPADFYTSFSLKRVDYIEPLALKPAQKVRKHQHHKAPQHASALQDSATTRGKDSTQPAIEYDFTTIEDYSEKGKQSQLLFQALHNAKSNNCRIAFYGDSFIEGDIMTMNLRDSLQKYFGGRGVGYLPVSSEVSMFRKSLPSESQEWDVYSIAKQSKKEALGIAGVTYVPHDGAMLKLLPPRALGNIRLFYRNLGHDVLVRTTINKKHRDIDTLKPSELLAVQPLIEGKDTIKQYQLKIEGGEGIKVYGISLEGGKGVYLDNFSIRGNSGLGLNEISDQQYRDFQQLMQYKLIVLQFGINVSNAEIKDYTFYEKGMVKLVKRLKALFPETSILLLSISDRSYKEDGAYVTMPSIPLLVASQRSIAEQSGILFWDMYSAMGGENSMVTWVDEKKANKDYTHLTFTGGRQIAGALFKAIMHEYKMHYKNKNDEKLTLATH